MKVDDFFDRQHQTDLLPLPLHFRLLRRLAVPRERVVAKLLPPSGRALLDIGCGEGELVRAVANRFARIEGTDVSAEAITRARALTPDAPHVRWSVVDANRTLPYEDSAFSTAVAMSTLQYIFDPEALLAEMHRVLSPGGTMLVEVPNMAYLPQRLRLLAGRPIRTSYWRHGIDGGNLHYFTVDLLFDLARRSGFEPVRVAGSGILAAPRSRWVSLLCGNVVLACTRR